MEEHIYWIWLQQSLGYRVRAQEIVSLYPSARALYEAGFAQWHISGLFNKRQLSALRDTPLERAQHFVTLCEKNNWHILTPALPAYPALLRKLADMPLVLYVQGDCAALQNQFTIAVVGTRSASEQSLRIAARLGGSLARAGVTIVSGGALGVDTAAHEGALRAKGQTVAVLGCGFGTNYLMGNQPLRESIAKQGALVTEYPPFYPASAQTFPTRNRIISGLSYGTVIVQAGERSGSLITAGFTLEQGRDVFAVPGDALSTSYGGVNKLIRDGAKPVFSAYDILEDYAVRYPGRINLALAEQSIAGEETAVRQEPLPKPIPSRKAEKPQAAAPSTPVPRDDTALSEPARVLLTCLEQGASMADELARASGLSVSAVLGAATELELAGHIRLLPGKRYELCCL